MCQVSNHKTVVFELNWAVLTVIRSPNPRDVAIGQLSITCQLWESARPRSYDDITAGAKLDVGEAALRDTHESKTPAAAHASFEQTQH